MLAVDAQECGRSLDAITDRQVLVVHHSKKESLGIKAGVVIGAAQVGGGLDTDFGPGGLIRVCHVSPPVSLLMSRVNSLII